MIRLNCFFQSKKGKYAEALEAAIAYYIDGKVEYVTIASKLWS